MGRAVTHLEQKDRREVERIVNDMREQYTDRLHEANRVLHEAKRQVNRAQHEVHRLERHLGRIDGFVKDNNVTLEEDK